MTDALTTSQVNKAGKVLRDWAIRARGERINVVRAVPERFDRLRPEQHAFFDSADASVIVALVNLFVFRSVISEAMAREEGGGRVDSKLQAALDDARAAALPYLRGGGRG